MTHSPLPTLSSLKEEAKSLRADLAASGKVLSHSDALEQIAQRYGYKNWNILRARASRNEGGPPCTEQARVSGTYLSQSFEGTVLEVKPASLQGRYHVTIHFDEPVDVVTFDSFSSYRQRVTCILDQEGISPNKTTEGQPHMMLDL